MLPPLWTMGGSFLARVAARSYRSKLTVEFSLGYTLWA